jgi:hypothetical protein
MAEIHDFALRTLLEADKVIRFAAFTTRIRSNLESTARMKTKVNIATCLLWRMSTEWAPG